MLSSRFAVVFLFIGTLLLSLSLSFSSAARDVSRIGRQHRAYMTNVREQRQRAKDSRLVAMGRLRWEVRQQRRDARRFGQ